MIHSLGFKGDFTYHRETMNQHIFFFNCSVIANKDHIKNIVRILKVKGLIELGIVNILVYTENPNRF